jgi:hypothetical protein
MGGERMPVTLLRLAGPVAGGMMLGAAVTGALSAARAGEAAKAVAASAKPAGEAATPAGAQAKPAGEPAGPCGNAVSILNEGKTFEAFDKLNGGGDRRLRFRLEGKEPCSAAGDCRVVIVASTAGAAAIDKTAIDKAAAGRTAATAANDSAAGRAAPPENAVSERVVATVSLAGRTASYCLYGVSRVPAAPPPRRDGCSAGWLVNFLAIRLVDGAGPFSRRDVSIQYLYRADASAVSLDTCTSPAVLDGMFRRRQWTVPLADGAAAVIGEIDFPRDRRAPAPQDAPFATAVAGARE